MDFVDHFFHLFSRLLMWARSLEHKKPCCIFLPLCYFVDTTCGGRGFAATCRLSRSATSTSFALPSTGGNGRDQRPHPPRISLE